ncbi:HicB-like protein involved in pilus formation [Stackebrandtia albiflava]|uniref:HicB-like protein involved in pilus formation n=1 Tax=Stackebrandtia albiflava TaxID=406432 RepID=A0A562VGY5_9ACTN|nr:toxin-antitoxin system HicB family antitoxin [Stackebrandtia albiflava]TWJ17155.1 HicB-like protein involved in pilus formation [Stackebrandtia albiflava]
MDLSPYLESLRRDLIAAAAPAGDDAVRTAELLSTSLESSLRLALLEALSDAAAEITGELNRVGNVATVEVRMRARQADLVVSESQAAPEPPPAPVGDSGDIARITLRLPEPLKEAVESAAAAESVSVNAWLVRAINSAVHGQPPLPPRGGPAPGRARFGKRVTGYAQA